MTKLARRTALATGIAAALAPRAMAQTWPERPVRLVVPAAAGGPTDVVARILQPHLQAILGQPLVVENKAGATGNIGTAVVAHAAADGYTTLLAPSTNSLTPALYGKALGYEPAELVSIAYVASVPLIVVAPIDGPKTLAELIAQLRKDPDKFSYASSG